jgi:hypothetical protein
MATLTIRDFDGRLKAELRVQAARHGRSVEAEVGEILRAALTRSASATGVGSRIRQPFGDIDDVSVPLPPRTEPPRAAEPPE